MTRARLFSVAASSSRAGRPNSSSSAAAFPGAAYAPYAPSSYAWNPYGTGLSRQWWGMPMYFMTEGLANDTVWRADYNAKHKLKGGQQVALLELPMQVGGQGRAGWWRGIGRRLTRVSGAGRRLQPKGRVSALAPCAAALQADGNSPQCIGNGTCLPVRRLAAIHSPRPSHTCGPHACPCPCRPPPQSPYPATAYRTTTSHKDQAD